MAKELQTVTAPDGRVFRIMPGFFGWRVITPAGDLTRDILSSARACRRYIRERYEAL